MICPNCRSRVPDDAVICDTCNHILDASFLGDGITNEPGEQSDSNKTNVRAIAPPPEPEQPKGKKKKKSEAAPAPPVASAAVADVDDSDPDRRKSSLSAVAAVPNSVNESVFEISDQYKAFPRSERIMTASAAIFLLSLGLPWRWFKAGDDSIIGFMAGAWPMGLLALYVAAAPYLRRLPRLRPFKSQFVAGMAASATLTAAATLFYVKSSFAWEAVRVGGHKDSVLSACPHLGAWLGAGAAVGMFAGGIQAFIQRERLPDA